LKLGLFSDIHCNLTGLQRALELLDDCDELLCAGDILYQYRFSGEVLATLRDHNVHAIVGNHDRTILYVPSHPLRSSPKVDPADLRYLGEIPDTLSLRLGGTDIAMFHGSPWDNVRTASAHYVYPANQADMKRVAQVPADIVVLGHTHQAFSAWVNGTLIVNPGSCGESRDPSGLLTCAALDVASGEVAIRSFSA
jgi:putative phosphoesterase